jgi:hypothetical protein
MPQFLMWVAAAGVQHLDWFHLHATWLVLTIN